MNRIPPADEEGNKRERFVDSSGSGLDLSWYFGELPIFDNPGSPFDKIFLSRTLALFQKGIRNKPNTTIYENEQMEPPAPAKVSPT